MPSKPMKNHQVFGLLSVLLVSNVATISPAVNAQEKVCILTDAGKKVCGTPIKPIAYNPVSSSKFVTLTYPSYPNEVVKVELQKCSRKSSMVSCKFSIVKTEGDKNPDNYGTGLYAADGTNISQATDQKGEDYIASAITLGNSTSSDIQGLVMIRNQARSATLSFRIPPQVNYLQTLKIGTTFNSQVGIAQFSDVSISQ
jgi:hypothetical protein